MPTSPVFIASHARSAVVPVGGAFKHLHTHEIAAPVLQGLLQRAGLPADAVNAVVLGNALGAGGNPARMLALAGQLPLHCAAYSVDTQCCAGLDAIALGASLVASGQAEVVVSGGAEAWSRAPIRATRPLHAGDSAAPYERPPFAPASHEDPDLLLAAARYAASAGYSRAVQDSYAAASHARALAGAAVVASEIIPVAGVVQDAFPRVLSQRQLDRMPAVAQTDADMTDEARRDHAVSTVAISPKADAAALVLLVSEAACRRWGLQPSAQWLGHQSLGGSPAMPLVLALDAAQALLQREQLAWTKLAAIELHDAFAVQGLQWQALLENQGADASLLNRHGGGIARGHPIGASAAVALVRVLADLEQAKTGASKALGLAAVAGAGGLGSAALVRQTALLY